MLKRMLKVLRHHLEILRFSHYLCKVIKTKIIKDEEGMTYKKVVIADGSFNHTVFIPIWFDVVIVNIIEHPVIRTLFFTYSMN